MRYHLSGIKKKKGQPVNKNRKCCTVSQQQTDDTSQRPNEHLLIIHALCFRSEIFFLLLLSVTVEVIVKLGRMRERDEGAEEIKDRRDERRLREGERDDDKRKEKRER